MEKDEVSSKESSGETSEEEINRSHEELSVEFLSIGHQTLDTFVTDAFEDPSLYPFELVQTSLLLGISHSLLALNEKLLAVLLVQQVHKQDPEPNAWATDLSND